MKGAETYDLCPLPFDSQLPACDLSSEQQIREAPLPLPLVRYTALSSPREQQAAGSLPSCGAVLRKRPLFSTLRYAAGKLCLLLFVV